MSENSPLPSAARSISTDSAAAAVAAPVLAVALALGLSLQPASAQEDGYVAPDPAPIQWLERLANEDRVPLEGWTNYLPPSFDEHVKWINPQAEGEASENRRWADWYGKVIVVQSWSNANERSIANLHRIAAATREFSDIDVQFIALHTPEAADKAEEFIKNAEDWKYITAIDTKGDFCDKLGIYKTPVNIVIGRNAAVRYAGLNESGMRVAIDYLLDEHTHSAPCLGSRDLDGASSDRPGTGSFPQHNTNPRARNLQGQRAPDFHVQAWANHSPDTLEGRINVIKFWRTGCPHCITAIPKTEELARKYAGRVNFIALTHENQPAVEQGLARRQISLASLEQYVAIDTRSQMRQAVGSQGVPNAVVIDSDWIVRWQGHPAQITEQMLDQILEADGSGSAAPPKRWKAEREGTMVRVRSEEARPATERPQLRQRPDGQQRRLERRRIEIGPAEFPAVEGEVRAAVDLRGKPGPEFSVEQWVTAQPMSIGNKVTIVEFYRTSCPHCRRAIAKLNDFNIEFSGMLDIITLSNETHEVFTRQLEANQLTQRSFNHFVALDPSMKMQSAIRPHGVPHAIVLDSNWIVRWQGNPNSLTSEILEQIIVADAWKRRQSS